MKIVIQKLELTNFKCFRQKEITFNEEVTTIRGRNGVGKTTIADAILWCLFGKNTQGQADFDLKTHDENGEPIPNLDHSVEMVLVTTSPDDATFVYTLKRTLKEVWVKKRASEDYVFKNNTTEYMINGEVTTATDYKKYIASLVSEEVFKCITNPTYFPSLKWKEQRQFLIELVGDIDIEPTDQQYATLMQHLSDNNEDIIAYRKHLSYQIKKIKERLDRIPVRLEEQNKALPERLDWDSLNVQYAETQSQAKEVEEKITTVRSGFGNDVYRAEIRADIENVRRDMNNIEADKRIQFLSRQREHDNNIAELSRQFNQLVTNQRDLESKLLSLETLAKRCRETADKTFKEEQADIRAKWPMTQAKFNADEEGRCELCGQILPDDQLEKAKERFNIRTAELKQKLTERAAKAKQLLADAEQKAKDYEQQKADAEKSLIDTKREINRVFSEKAKLEKVQIPSLESLLNESEKYQKLLQTLDSLQKSLYSLGNDNESQELLNELEAQKVQYADVLQQLSTQLATRSQYERGLTLIEGIKEEEKELIRQLSELERKEDIARRYQDRQNQILESRINEHFCLVKWRMFRTVNNGGDPFDEPYCECYVDGVAYHDGLNQAARLNAGLDIINTLCKHYNVSAPIVIDNSESNLNILSTPSQQIRLEVFDSELQIV